MKKIIALCLVVCLLLTGCGMVDFGGFFDRLMNMYPEPVAFAEMEYTRPDMDAFAAALEAVLKEAETQENLNKLVSAINEFYAEYDAFYTAYALSNIHYSKDLRDTDWKAEYDFCMENTAQVDAGINKLFHTLAKSPLREKLEGKNYFGEGFFNKYEGDTLYDEHFQSLLTKEAQLEAQYYALSDEEDQTGSLEDIYIDLIRVRQDMADYAGYESYPEFSYEFHYGRDYTVQQARDYLADIQTELVPLYETLLTNKHWDGAYEAAPSLMALQHVQSLAEGIGGQVLEAYTVMEEKGLYDIDYNYHKADTSFEIFIRSYYTPYIFMDSTNTTLDQLTFAHEFGHFCADYINTGSGAGVDVAEVFSQGMEYLSLFHIEESKTDLTRLKLGLSIATYVEQAAYASFELQVYALEDEELTKANVQTIFRDTLDSYGISTTSGVRYTDIPHLFIAPMYVISYLVSNDLALQIYILEKEEAGAGAAKLLENITTTQSGIQAFAQEAGLTSPFAEGWIQTVKEILG